MKKPPACAQCYANKRKCDGKTPCHECTLREITCTPRQRAPYGSKKKRKRGHQKKAHHNKKTKTITAQPKGGNKNNLCEQPHEEDISDISDIQHIASRTTESFWSKEIDLNVWRMLKGLSPSHWGFKCAMIIMMTLAVRKGKVGLMHIATSLATAIGFNSYFPIFSSKRVFRDVKVGEYDTIPAWVMRKHDEAIGAPATAAGAWNHESDRMFVGQYKEFDSSGAVFFISPEARRLLVSDDMYAEFPTTIQPMDLVVNFIFGDQGYTAISGANMSMGKDYTTQLAGPLSRVVKNLKIMTHQGPIKVHSYQTMWLGYTGYDGVWVQELVPVDKESPTAKAEDIAVKEEEAQAAQAMMQFTSN